MAAPMQAPSAMPCSPPPMDMARRMAGFAGQPSNAARARSAPKKQGLLGKLRKAFGGAPGAEKAEASKLRDSTLDRSVDFDAMMDLSEEESAGAPGDGGSGDALVDLLALQQADGSFANLSSHKAMLAQAGVDGAAMSAWVADVVSRALPNEAAQTLAAICVIRLKFSDRQAVWKRAAKKAIGFVMAQASVSAKEVEAWVDEIVRRSQAA